MRRGDGSWGYPLLAAAMAEARFKKIGTYVTRRHNTVAQYIATRMILDLYKWSTRGGRGVGVTAVVGAGRIGIGGGEGEISGGVGQRGGAKRGGMIFT